MPHSPLLRPAPTPTAPVGPAFRVHDALAVGHTLWSTAPARMRRPTSSVRTLRPLREFPELVGAFALALPDDVVFSHTTAARLWRIPLPRALNEDRGLHVMRATPRSRIVRKGCISHKGLERRHVDEVGGLAVTSLADTWLDLIQAFHDRLSIADAVMVGDAVVERLHPTKFVHDLHPQSDPASGSWWQDPQALGCADLLTRFHGRPPIKGRGLVRKALGLVRPRVWSPMESYSRVALVQDGIPEPSLNVEIRSDDDPRRTVIGDMGWSKGCYRTKVVGEYNGATHEEQERRESDHSKRLFLEDHGFKLLEIYARDVSNGARRRDLVGRLALWLGL